MSFFKKVTKSLGGAVLGAGAGFALGGPVGAAIGAGAGGYLNYVQNAQNEANKKAVDRANAYDMYTWDLANKYNDPKAQMERLKAAGLNPNLVYGSGNVTGNTTGVAGSNGVANQEVFNAVSKGLPLAQGLANLRNTNSQNQLLQYQMGQTAAQTAQVRAETRNLNNFLDGNGPSTYDPYVSKTGNAIDRAITGKNSYFRKFSEGVGDAVWHFTQGIDKAGNWLSSKTRSWFGG